MNLKLWLDDERSAPDATWFRVTTANEAIGALQAMQFDVVSLDHDLGEPEAGTGYDVICWLEERVAKDPTFQIPKVYVHTQNAGALRKMMQAAGNIARIRKARFQELET